MADNYDWLEPVDEREPLEDAYVEQAKPELLAFLNSHRERVFYLKQLQVLFEKPYFHWITAKALYQLEADHEIQSVIAESPRGTRVRLFFAKGHRYWKRQARRLLELVDEMSEPQLAMACGEHADVLFFSALTARQFMALDQDTRTYNGKTWEETEHNLDFIIERDGIAYGCEVKNKWDYIDRDELLLKIDLCAYLGLRPLFIVRASPKSYNNAIMRAVDMS